MEEQELSKILAQLHIWLWRACCGNFARELSVSIKPMQL